MSPLSVGVQKDFVQVGASFVEGKPVLSIVKMTQTEKLDLANKMVDIKSVHADITRLCLALCEDPDITSGFLSDREVQMILLLAILQGKNLNDSLITKMSAPACISAITKDDERVLMHRAYQWLPASLHNKSNMLFITKFFQDPDLRQMIVNAILHGNKEDNESRVRTNLKTREAERHVDELAFLSQIIEEMNLSDASISKLNSAD